MNEKYANDAATFTCRDRRGNARAGYWNGGPVPFGYESRVATVDGRKERKKLALHESEAAVVQLIVHLVCVGLTGQPMGTRAIAKYWNDNGYTLRGRNSITAMSTASPPDSIMRVATAIGPATRQCRHMF